MSEPGAPPRDPSASGPESTPPEIGERRPAPEDADIHLGETLVMLVLRPGRTLDKLVAQKTPRPGASAIALLGTFWSMFLVLLWNTGQAPSFVLLPIPLDWYYLVEALALLPVLTGLWWLHSEITHRLAVRFGGEGQEAGVRAALGFAYATPMMVLVLTELAVYLALGFEGLGRVARVGLPLAGVAVGAISTAAVRRAHRIPTPKAAIAALVGLLVNGLAAGLFIR